MKAVFESIIGSAKVTVQMSLSILKGFFKNKIKMTAASSEWPKKAIAIL